MERWFYSGAFMKDGTPITIAARSAFVEEECLRQGLRPCDEVKKKKIRPRAVSPARFKKK